MSLPKLMSILKKHKVDPMINSNPSMSLGPIQNLNPSTDHTPSPMLNPESETYNKKNDNTSLTPHPPNKPKTNKSAPSRRSLKPPPNIEKGGKKSRKHKSRKHKSRKHKSRK